MTVATDAGFATHWDAASLTAAADGDVVPVTVRADALIPDGCPVSR